MITKPTSRTKLKEMFLEILLSKTDKISKVSKGSVLNAVAHGVATLSQKTMKDIAVLESNIFPDSAFGEGLDIIALRTGVPSRFGQAESTTYVRLVGDIGTTYEAGVHNVTGSDGVIFELDIDVTIGDSGFIYGKVTSTSQGESTNVSPLSLKRIVPTAPVGHKFIVNEFFADGGRDNENDDQFRIRIKEGVNVLATGTLSSYEQSFININPSILNVYKGGFSETGKSKFLVSTVNGKNLTENEIVNLVQGSADFMNVQDFISGVEISNIDYHPIDISVRVELKENADPALTRIDMQSRMSTILDWRRWTFGDFVEFESMLIIAKQSLGVNRVLEGYFSPSTDIQPPQFSLPRIRGFLLLDKNGDILNDGGNDLNPVFYPNVKDFRFQETLLNQS